MFKKIFIFITKVIKEISAVGTLIAERSYPEDDPDGCTACTACTGEVRSCTQPDCA